ncbi:hypothetical protein ACIA03_05990 [Nocardioides sp. NPDC051685]|uniref:hypothetical protein n=1 Tax=Nocardioides sp. NPDC051685 TaxID=3364334 RepID=UPI0037AC58FC
MTYVTSLRRLRTAEAVPDHPEVSRASSHQLSSWQVSGAVDKTEWANQIRTVSTASGNYYIQESLHPNYWGQLALRNCLRQAYNGGAPRSGTCTHGTGLNANGEPIMTLS